jgi:hypothetical protein
MVFEDVAIFPGGSGKREWKDGEMLGDGQKQLRKAANASNRTAGFQHAQMTVTDSQDVMGVGDGRESEEVDMG